MQFIKNTIYIILLLIIGQSNMLGQGPITFNIGSASGMVGDIVCVDVTVEGFDNVASMEWFNRWNSNVVLLDTILVDNSAMNANGMNLLPVSSFNFLEATPKYGKFTWFDPATTGVSLVDGAILYTICFELIGDPCETSIVDITGGDNEISIEIAVGTDSSVELPLSDIIINPGLITIDPAGYVISESHCSSDDNGDTGSITFAGAGGTGPYSWTVSGNGVNQSNLPGEEIEDCETATVDGLPPGQYTITFTDANNVIRNEIVEISTNSSFPFILSLDSMNPTCFDKNNGEISIDNINGGDGPFSYAWSNSQFGESIEDLVPGEYALTITDINGCTTSASTELAVDTLQVSIEVISDPSCNGGSNGVVSFTASGGTAYANGGYDYDIDGVDPTFYFSNGSEIPNQYIVGNLFEGCFSAVVVDALGCQSDPAEFCLEAGSFSTLVVDTTNVSCFGACDGSVLLTAGSTGNFTFQVSDGNGGALLGISGATTFSASNLCPGTYDAIVTNSSDGCFVDTSFTITEPLLLELSVVDSVGPGCGGGDGMITFEALGGTEPYDFIWDDAFDQSTRENMPGGTYSVTVSDFNGCRDSIMWTFAEGGDIGLTAGVLNAVSCESAQDGSVRATVSAAGSFTYTWEDNDGASLGTGEIITNLGGGIYFVTATDGECTDTTSVILAPGQTPAAAVTMVPPLCSNSTDGMLTATLLEGVAPAMFSWSQPPSTAIISNGAIVTGGVGIYNLNIVDANGCESDELFEIMTSPDSLQVVISDQTENICFGSCNGGATFTASGGPAGTGEYTFIISGNPVVASGGVATVSDLCAGTNFVIVIDGVCSSDTMFFDVMDADEILIDIDNSTLNPPACDGGNDGSISVVVTGGNPSNYDLLWLNEGIMGTDLTGLQTGEYILQITDGNGCIVNDTVDLITPDPLTVEVDLLITTSVTCSSDSNGQIGLITTGGNAGELTYTWSPDVSDSSIASNLSPGIYSVTVSDVNGCTAETSYEFTSAPPIDFSLPTPEEPECFGGTTCISVTDVTGGVGGGYSYTVANGTPLIPIDSCFEVFANTYTITVFDSTGCSAAQDITIDQPSQVTVDVGEDIMIDLGESSEPVSAFIVSELDVDSIAWTPDVDIECNTVDCQIVTFSPNQSTTYTITVTDENGCLATDDITVIVDLARNVYIPNIFSPNSNNTNDHFQVVTGSGVVSINYLKIYDRWGTLVHLEENYMPNDTEHIGWDGSLNGGLAETGVYVFISEVEFVDGVSIVYKGDVTLLR